MATGKKGQSATPEQIWEVIATAVRCFVAGSFLILLTLTLPFNELFKPLVGGFGVALIIIAPILLISTLCLSRMPWIFRILGIVKTTTVWVSLMSMVITTYSIISVYQGNGWQPLTYIIYEYIVLILLIVAMITFYIRNAVKK